MLSPDNARDKLADLVVRAKKAGADAADAITVSNASSSVHVREGRTEDVSRSESEATGLRLFVGTRSASASTSDLSSAAMDALVERVVAMAREAPEDPYAGLAPEELLAKGDLPDIDGWDPVEPTPEALKGVKSLFLVYPYINFPARSNTHHWEYRPRTLAVLARSDFLTAHAHAANIFKRLRDEGKVID